MSQARKPRLVAPWVFIGAFLVLCGMLAAAAWNMVQVNRLEAQRVDSTARILALFTIHRELLEAETSQRGYVLTGDPNFLDEFEMNREAVLRLRDELDRTGVSEPVRMEDIHRVEDLAMRRLDALQSVLDLHAEEGRDAAIAAVRGRRGAAIMERFVVLNTTVIDAEMHHLQRVRERTTRSNNLLNLLLAAGTLLILALAVGTLFSKQRDLRVQRTLARQLDQGSARVTLLNELNSNLLACRDFDEAYPVIAHGMQQLFPDVAGGVYMYRASRDILELRASWGEMLGEPRGTILNDECWSLRRGHVHHYRTVSDLPCAHWKEPSGFVSVCLPMMALGDTIGVIFIQAPAEEAGGTLFQKELLDLAGTVTSQVANAAANLSLRAALHQQSIKDPLTGLFNRRYLEETLQRETIRAKRNGSPVTVIMADIDRFKSFNDSHGHHAGDLVLQRFAAVLSGHVRGDDLACRYGGEEFTLVLPGADLEHGLERAEKLRQATGGIRVDFKGSALPEITASFGVASFPEHGDDYREVIQRADQALYRAKQNGRNRVEPAA